MPLIICLSAQSLNVKPLLYTATSMLEWDVEVSLTLVLNCGLKPIWFVCCACVSLLWCRVSQKEWINFRIPKLWDYEIVSLAWKLGGDLCGKPQPHIVIDRKWLYIIAWTSGITTFASLEKSEAFFPPFLLYTFARLILHTLPLFFVIEKTATE